MPLIRRVLFPVDFSVFSRMMTPTARMLADYWGADLTLLHVIEPRRWNCRARQFERVIAELDDMARHKLAGARVNRAVKRGEAAQCILEYARATGVDLIVMPARGLGRNPLGHVTAQVLAEALCAVWLDWDASLLQPESGMRARRICCSIGLDEFDEHSLRTAASIAVKLGASLTIAQAILPEPGKPAAVLWDENVRERAVRTTRLRIDNLRQKVFPGADVAIEVASGEALVNKVVREQGAGLLVTAGPREYVLAAEPTCPVWRVAVPASLPLCHSASEPAVAFPVRRIA